MTNNLTVALAEWLRRVPAKYIGYSRDSSNLSGDVILLSFGESSYGLYPMRSCMMHPVLLIPLESPYSNYLVLDV